MPDLELRGLTKRYGAVIAVDDLVARARSGPITAFLGATGSGKTTTMRMLLGVSNVLDEPFNGLVQPPPSRAGRLVSLGRVHRDPTDGRPRAPLTKNLNEGGHHV